MTFAGTPAQLTVAQRSCLLRAARARLAQLQDLYDHMSGGAWIDPGITVRRDELFEEMACIIQGIAWMWSQTCSDEPPRGNYT